MKIYVRAYGTFKGYLRGKKEIELCLEQGSTMVTIFRKLRKQKSEIWMVSVNGKITNEKTVLKDGDVVGIFEPVRGG